ncbi:hypothetical protein ON010_g10476 [Phytophthora cinnamomi]|nr:hypothetical protein ON010_g10476 [Phytophthora cinnamomi]
MGKSVTTFLRVFGLDVADITDDTPHHQQQLVRAFDGPGQLLAQFHQFTDHAEGRSAEYRHDQRRDLAGHFKSAVAVLSGAFHAALKRKLHRALSPARVRQLVPVEVAWASVHDVGFAVARSYFSSSAALSNDDNSDVDVNVAGNADLSAAFDEESGIEAPFVPPILETRKKTKATLNRPIFSRGEAAMERSLLRPARKTRNERLVLRAVLVPRGLSGSKNSVPASALHEQAEYCSDAGCLTRSDAAKTEAGRQARCNLGIKHTS